MLTILATAGWNSISTVVLEATVLRRPPSRALACQLPTPSSRDFKRQTPRGYVCSNSKSVECKLTSTQDTTFVVNVTSTDPIWYYCSLASHCQAGMAGVVNPPSGKTITDYTDAAKKVAQASSPATMTGGVLTSINEAAESTMVGTSSSAITGSGGPLQPATTTTSTGTSATSVQTGVQASPTSSTSTGATPSPTKSEARKGSDLSILLGLSVVVGGLVVLMA